MLGGEDVVEPFEVWSDVWMWDPATDTWQALESLPTPRHGHGVVSLGDGLHLLASSVTSGGTGTTVLHHLFDPK